MVGKPIEYRIFESDEYRNLMPKVIEQGFMPISSKDGMRLILCALTTRNPENIERLVDSYIDTGDGLVAYQEQLIMVPSARQLQRINRLTNLVSGKLPFTPDEISVLKGVRLIRTTLEEAGVNTDLTKAQALNHPGWLARAGADADLLREFVEAAYAYVKERFGYGTTMSFYLPASSDNPLMRAGFISYLGWRFEPGDYGLLTSPGRIVGIRNQLPDSRLESLVHV